MGTRSHHQQESLVTYPTVTVRIYLESMPYPVWRRIEVPAKTALDRFHQLLSSDGSTALYVYDYGDEWVHHLTRQIAQDRTAEFEGSVFLGGLGTCPPEDSGGPAGFERLYELKQRQAKDPASLTEDERELMDILGDRLDPENPQLEDRAFLVQAMPTSVGLRQLGPVLQDYFSSHDSKFPTIVTVLAVAADRSLVDETGTRFLSTELTDEIAAEIAKTIRTWLSYFEDDVKLTEAGWLPPKLVDQLIDDGVADPVPGGEKQEGRREMDEPHVHSSREILTQLGCLRKYTGALMVPKKIQAILDDDRALVEASVPRLLPKVEDERLRDAFGPTRFLLQGLTPVQAAQFGRYLLTHLE